MDEVAHIAQNCSDLRDRADAVAHALHPVIPFRGSWIAVLDPVHAEHHTLHTEGLSSAAEAYARSAAVLADIELVGANHSAEPVTVHRMRVPADVVPVWRDYLAPDGFRGAAAAGLFSGSRYVGIVTLQTDDPAQPTDEALRLLRVLSPTIAQALDPLSAVSTTAELLHEARAGILLTRDGRSGPLPGLPADPRLDDGTALREVIDSVLAGGRPQSSFVVPDDETPAGFDRVTVVQCDSPPPFHVAAAVVVSDVRDLHGLAPVDLAVLGLLAAPPDSATEADASAQQLVHERMPRIAATLHARTRVQAVARALRLGLLVPPPLAGPLLRPGSQTRCIGGA